MALFMLLVPGWQARIFEPVPPSPFELLEEAPCGLTMSRLWNL